MSGLIAICGGAAVEYSPDRVVRILRETSRRGREVSDIEAFKSSVLAGVRDRWEFPDDIAGETIVARRGHIGVVSDASLYFRSDLAARLRDRAVDPASGSPADLLAAAYDAYGEDLLGHLEGDFAFAVWNDRTETLWCARDPFGFRSLFFAEVSGCTVVASTIDPLIALHQRLPDFDPEGVFRSLSLTPGSGTRTALCGISEVPAGHTLVVESGRPRLARFWHARGASGGAATPASAAPHALAELLSDAAGERLIPNDTALAMSGGYDSTAVAASLPDASPSGSFRILSLRYPKGDPGEEDHYVNMAADHLGIPVEWVDTEEVSLFGDPVRRARARPDPAGHPHEGQNRALARAARDGGSRVLLNGHGGDNIFWADDVIAADLLRRGHFGALRRFLGDRGYRGWDGFKQAALRPALPLGVLDVLERLRQRPINSRPHEHPIPDWLSPPADLASKVRREDRELYTRDFVREYRSISDRQRAFSLMFTGFARISANLFDVVRDEGVELRMPMFDRRVVGFTLSRPPEELNRPGEIKSLLRQAMKGRLPDELLGPRGQRDLKTGTADGYVRRRFLLEAPALVSKLDNGGRPWISDQLGIVSRARFLEFLNSMMSGSSQWEVHILITLLAEQWLQARSSR